MFNQRVKKRSTVHTRTRIQHSMSRLFALGLLLLGSARADDDVPAPTPTWAAAGCSGCSDTDNGAGDSPFGDSCVDWYDANPGSCGGYDDTDFTSNEMCCACGGGDTLAPVPAPTPVPCQDSTTWRMPNNENKGCEWVGRAKPKKRCTKRGADGEKAKRACPATCGGCPGDDDGATVA